MTTSMTQQERPTHDERRYARSLRRPWYRRARYLVPVVAVAAIAAAGVSITAQDAVTTAPERDTGTAATPASRYDAAFGTFPATTVSGTGSGNVDLPASLAAEARGGIITVNYRGADRFDITLRNGPGLVKPDSGGLSLGTFGLRGPYNGSFLFGNKFVPGERIAAQAADTPWTLIVWSQSDSKAFWQVTFAPISSARELGAVTNGQGDEVLLYDGEFARLHVVTSPPASYTMAQWDLKSLQGFQPSAYLYPGPAVVAVSSSGLWRATLTDAAKPR